MSFTVRVKEELLSIKRFEKSELAAIIKMSGSLGISTGGLTLSVTTFTEESGLYGFLG